MSQTFEIKTTIQHLYINKYSIITTTIGAQPPISATLTLADSS